MSDEITTPGIALHGAENEQPPVPDFLKDDQWFDVDVGPDFLDFTEPYTPPRYTMRRFDVPFANVGELHIISGKPGNGKTGLMSQLMATLLCGKFGNIEYALSEVRPHPRVLYIDTEQGKDDTIAVKNRVCSLAGLPYDQPLEQFKILRLHDTEEAKERWAKTLKAIWQCQPTDIFLDGLLDIVKDYNDQVECQPIIRKCMMTATHYDASLWTVLHENPMVDKLVGTLGSIAQRKVAEIFTVTKVKQGDLKEHDRRADLPDIYFRVKQVKARGRDVADWLFYYDSTAGGWGHPVEIDDKGTTVTNTADLKAQQFIKEADDRFSKLKWVPSGLSRTEVDNALYSQGVTSNRRRGALIDTGLEHGIIYKTGDKSRPKYHYNGLEKKQPNDEEEDIDFTLREGPDVF
jgi:hypothetical protein